MSNQPLDHTIRTIPALAFCDPTHNGKFSGLRAPFSVARSMYSIPTRKSKGENPYANDTRLAATDTRVLIVFARELLPADCPVDVEGRVPPVMDLFQGIEKITEDMWIEGPGGDWRDGEPLRWPTIPPVCFECKNTGWIPEQPCDECQGTGKFVRKSNKNDRLRFYPCEDCDGLGKVFNVECGSCGESFAPLGNRHFSRRIIRRLMLLPDLMWAAPERKKNYTDADDSERPIFIRFEGGIGIICPLSADHAQERAARTG
ncbi:MAG: hypothetical protein NT069_25930 [Planctomycetota bacterium]|nr:hypothetical protein [Planctomycetota bacterium]